MRKGERLDLENLWKLMQVSLKQVAFAGYLDTFRGQRMIIKTSGRQVFRNMCYV